MSPITTRRPSPPGSKNAPTGNTPARWPSPSSATLLALIGVVFILYLVIGLAMPVLPLFVHRDLGFGTVMVGVVVGSQSAVAIISRMGAGVFTDSRGVKLAVLIGLLLTIASGGCSLAAALAEGRPGLSVVLLVAGRLCLGAGENMLLTGAMCWGMMLMGSEHSGQVMSWIGTSIFGAMAVSSPLGTVAYDALGFRGVAVISAALPLLALPLALRLRPVAPSPHVRPALRKVAGAVWTPGLGLALSGIGFNAITTFITLLYVSKSWGGVWIVLSAMSVFFMVGRLCLGSLPDRIGGKKVAVVSILVEALGQGLIWTAEGPTLALIGVSLTGLGYSLVYPALGVEALRRVSVENRGLAMGTYTVFLDISLCVTGPLLGLIGSRGDLNAIYLAGMIVALCAAGVVTLLLRPPREA